MHLSRQNVIQMWSWIKAITLYVSTDRTGSKITLTKHKNNLSIIILHTDLLIHRSWDPGEYLCLIF